MAVESAYGEEEDEVQSVDIVWIQKGHLVSMFVFV